MWRELTQDDIRGVLSAAEFAAYQAAAVADGQDPAADAITAVVNQCRGYIDDNPENKLAAGTTLPERVILPALHMIRVELLTRLDLEVSQARSNAQRDAIRFFERVASGDVKIEQPEGETDSSGAGASMELVSNYDRVATRDTLAGL